MLNDLAGLRHIILWAVSAIAVIVSFYGVGLTFTAPEQSFASELSLMSNPQRCGDRIHFFFNDETGKNIDPARFTSMTIDINGSEGVTPEHTERNRMKGFSARTLCGIRQMTVKVVYKNRQMELILKRIRGDSGDVALYSIPFSEGTYMFDFEYDFVKNCEDYGIHHYECTISPKRIRKVTPDSNKGEKKQQPGSKEP